MKKQLIILGSIITLISMSGCTKQAVSPDSGVDAKWGN